VARRLLNLRDVPEDESDEVRALLDAHAIEYYETPPSRWGVSMGGIWISRDGDYPRARELMDEYQADRAERMRADHAARKERGEAKTFAAVFRERPLQVLAYLTGAAAIIAVMLWPVWLLLR